MKKNITSIFWLSTITLFFVLNACAQHKPDNNMKWINKYDFFDLYQMKVMNGSFNPGAAITLRQISIPDEST